MGELNQHILSKYACNSLVESGTGLGADRRREDKGIASTERVEEASEQACVHRPGSTIDRLDRVGNYVEVWHLPRQRRARSHGWLRGLRAAGMGHAADTQDAQQQRQREPATCREPARKGI